MFYDCGAVLDGHFLLTSGLHSDVYWEKMRVVQNPKFTERLCSIIAEHCKNTDIDLVAGPITAGIILAYEVAKKLDKPCIFAEKAGNERQFKRGIQLKKDDKVLVVDDILTTGKSVNEVINAVEQAKAKVVSIAVLVDRSQDGLEFGSIPLFSCLRAPSKAFEPSCCPLCKKNMPLTILGGGKT